MKPQEVEELERVVAKSSEKGITNALVKLGIDINDPIETQKDLAFIREQRLTREHISKFTKGAVITTVFSGLVSLVVLGITKAMK
jgi:hypothetical protein